MEKVLFSSDRMDWETPKDLFNKYNSKYSFSLDVCSTHDNAKCEKHFTIDDDGLAQDWHNDVCWMNPPYGRDIIHWMKKAYEESLKGAVVVCLVPSRTDTKWWHEYAIKGDIEFLRGRIKFVGAKSSAPFPSAVVVFDKKKEKS